MLTYAIESVQEKRERFKSNIEELREAIQEDAIDDRSSDIDHLVCCETVDDYVEAAELLAEMDKEGGR